LRIRHFLLALVLLGAAGAATGYTVLHQNLAAPGPLMEEKLVYIEPGSSVRSIASQLIEQGAMAKDWPFILGARLQKDQGNLKAGEYQVAAGVSAQSLLELLRTGKTFRRKVTIPEGLTSLEIASIINKADALEGTIDRIPDEGSLLPETYDYIRGDTRVSIINRMQKAMQEAIQRLWVTHAEKLPIETPEEAVILASIVEKETGVAGERPRIAGVFVNRLNIGMPLQSDPTVIYAITQGKSKLERPLWRSDLTVRSPYNTYVTPGLPPTPIANPGMASLAAVMNPETNEFLYFVADGTGGHAFAKTLKEHNKNVSAWRSIEKKVQ
jgi:UPF0755 protein